LEGVEGGEKEEEWAHQSQYWREEKEDKEEE